MNPQDGVHLLHDPKVAAGAAAVGGVSGLGAIFGFIPVILGIVVSTLTSIMLIVLIRMYLLNSKKTVLEMKQLKEEAHCRKEAGLECRRHGDNTEED
ncbi:MAG: hypothetical protein KAR06_09185 [Deltaproteobacteria bacterium]|nr:hypothetical protein [Deltaproteobacteria bacterium]